MTPPLPKPRDTKPLLSPTTSQEPIIAPKQRCPNYCTYVTYVLLSCSIIIGGIAPCTYYLSQNCTKAEEIVQKMCEPELKRVRAFTEITIPDFGPSPIAMDVAKKCDYVTECLSAVKCYRLRSISEIPERCPMFQFFNGKFRECRQKLIDIAYHQNIDCLKAFFGMGPVQCDLLNEHVDCVLEQISDLCDVDDVEDDFRRHIDDYRLIIECPESDIILVDH